TLTKQTFSQKNKTYEIYTDKMTFNDAKDVCFKRGGSLLEISDEIENNYITRRLLFDERYWIGAKRIMHYSSIFLYTNGKNMKYINWPATEPKPSETSNCVNIMNGKMYVDNCNESLKFICEYTNHSTDSSGDVILEDVIKQNIGLHKKLKDNELKTSIIWKIIGIR
ncbi:hypothetical protein B4U80_14620, partial [Leptotrombidium deliense]